MRSSPHILVTVLGVGLPRARGQRGGRQPYGLRCQDSDELW